MADDVTRNYRIRYLVEDKASPGIKKIQDAFAGLNLEIDSSVPLVAAFTKSLDGFKGKAGDIGQIAGAMGRMRAAAAAAEVNVDNLGMAVGAVGSKGSAVADLGASFTKAQRAAYGFRKNVEEGADAIDRLKASGADIATVGPRFVGLGRDVQGVDRATKATSSTMVGFIGKMAALGAVREAAQGFSEAMAEGRRQAEEAGEYVEKVRDSLREIANLRGKAGPDDAVVGQALKLRVASGMNDSDARKFTEQFLGSLPAAKDKGGITQEVGDQLAGQTSRLAVRVGLDAQTAGDLTGSLGAFGKVGSARAGLGQVQGIVDQLNDGRGNLSPLTKELMKNAAGTVGKGQAFGSLNERAAAVATSTTLGAIGGSSTRIDQAVRALGGFEKTQGETLRAHGIEGSDDFLTRIDKIAPVVERAIADGRSADEALSSGGFGNQTDRRSIIGFVQNRAVLRKRTEAARGVDRDSEANGDRSARLNADFYGRDKAAAGRVGRAAVESAEALKGIEQEPLDIARRNAEAQLKLEGKIDTPGQILGDKLNSGFGFTQHFLGWQDPRQERIDLRVRENLKAGAKQAGIKVPNRPGWGGLSSDGTTPEQTAKDVAELAPQIQAKGANPYGDTKGVEERLDRLIRLQEDQNARRAQQPIPPPLPPAGGNVRAIR